MKRKLTRLILIIAVLGALGLLIRHYTRPKPIAIIVKTVEKGVVERTVANTRAGTVEACRRAKLSPSIGGQIATLPIREGDSVKAGDLLLELWNEDLKADLKLAKNETRVSKARAKAACLNAEEAQRDANRLLKLKKMGAAAEDRTDQAITRSLALKAECAAARASVHMSISRESVAKARLDRSQLKAPFNGIIAQINGEMNEYLTPSPPGIPTPPAVDLIDNTCFYVTAPIDEVDASGIKPGMTARITMDAFGDRQFMGSVRRIAPFVLDREKQARTVDVEVTFSSPEDIKQLLAGYSADVEIILDSHPETLRIPTEAVLEENRVYVFSPEDQIIHERNFEKGLSNWNHTELISGLNAGDLVVINVDQTGLKDGVSAVREKNSP